MKTDPEQAAASGSRWDQGWVPGPRAIADFTPLEPGTTITVAKWSPAGAEVTRYPARVVRTAAPAPWVEMLAHWILPRIEVAGLAFEPGDTLHEFFSPRHPFNAFAVFAPDGALRGWYGNVTFPSFIHREAAGPVLVWRDLYLDAIILPDGTTRLLDDDELDQSGLPGSDPAFATAIVRAREDLIRTIPALLPATEVAIRKT